MSDTELPGSAMHTVGLVTDHAGNGRKTFYLMYVYPIQPRLSKLPFSMEPFQQTLMVNNFIVATSVIGITWYQ